MNYKDRSWILVVFGILLLLIGIAAALLGPIEMYCFYLFSEGGRFHYEGFGFGSFMFGNIACQIIGYYLIAALFIPLGYGHLQVRRWARTLALTLLRFWLVVGAPLTVAFFFILVTAKELSLAAVLIAALILALSYLAIPGVLIRFYQSHNVRLTFEARESKPCWIERFPIPVLVLCSLYVFYAVALHIPIFFNGVFPLFGFFLSDLQGILLLDLAIACLVLLTWSTLRMQMWAWWGALIYFVLITISSFVTLFQSSYADILSALEFPPREMEFLDQIPVHGSHFAVFIGIPLLLTIGAIILSKRHFGAKEQIPSQ